MTIPLEASFLLANVETMPVIASFWIILLEDNSLQLQLEAQVLEAILQAVS